MLPGSGSCQSAKVRILMPPPRLRQDLKLAVRVVRLCIWSKRSIVAALINRIFVTYLLLELQMPIALQRRQQNG